MASRKRLRDWGRAPGRAAEVRAAAAEAPKRAPGKKDTRRWCHGREGREHALVITFRGLYGRVCEWQVRWVGDGIGWHCEHEETCASCGKILRAGYELARAECPAYPGAPEQRAEAEAELRRDREWRIQRALRRAPVITGPQGYRRRSKERA